MSASPCFQCFKAVFFLHFYPSHVSKVSRKERKCYFLSAICSVNSLFCSTTTLPSALTEALRNKSYSCYCTFFSSHNAPCNSKTVFVRLCALIISGSRIWCLGCRISLPPHLPAVLIWYFSFLYISVVNCDPLSASRCVSRLRPHTGYSGSTTG